MHRQAGKDSYKRRAGQRTRGVYTSAVIQRAFCRDACQAGIHRETGPAKRPAATQLWPLKEKCVAAKKVLRCFAPRQNKKVVFLHL